MSPSPGVSLSSGPPLPVVPPSQGSLSPGRRAHGQTRGHSPAGYGAERGSLDGGSLVRQRAQNRPALLAGPAGPLAPEVTHTGRAKAVRRLQCACVTSARGAGLRSPPGGLGKNWLRGTESASSFRWYSWRNWGPGKERKKLLFSENTPLSTWCLTSIVSFNPHIYGSYFMIGKLTINEVKSFKPRPWD